MPTILHTAYQLVRNQFELPEAPDTFDEQKAIGLLTEAIRRLLDSDLEKLLQICYRIDLPEAQLKQILHTAPPDRVARDLAVALWERHKKKAEIRKKYS